MSDLTSVDVSLDCKEIDSVSAYGRKISIDLDSVDMSEFVNDHQKEILEWIDVEEVSKWLEEQGYRVEEEQ